MTHAGADQDEVDTVSDPDAPDVEMRPCRPSRRFRLVHAWRLDDPRDLARVRRELRPWVLPETGADDVPDRLVLVASELATNALVHGSAPATVRLCGDRHDYLLDVVDRSVATAPHVATGRAPGEGGFGLQIARRLSADVGWYTTGSTKHVWATFTS